MEQPIPRIAMPFRQYATISNPAKTARKPMEKASSSLQRTITNAHVLFLGTKPLPKPKITRTGIQYEQKMRIQLSPMDARHKVSVDPYLLVQQASRVQK